jgi:two-component system response regulator QseB
VSGIDCGGGVLIDTVWMTMLATGVTRMDDAKLSLLWCEGDSELGPAQREVLAEIYDVELIGDGSHGLEVALGGTFDVIVVDREVPAVGGVNVVRRLRAAGIATPVLMVASSVRVEDVVDGLDCGANAYLKEPFEFDELLARLRALTRVFDPQGAAFAIGGWTFYPEDRCVRSPGVGRILLTPRENALLNLFVQNPTRVFSRVQILLEVFSADERPGTVDAYVHYLRRKTTRKAVVTVRGEGYRLGQL